VSDDASAGRAPGAAVTSRAAWAGAAACAAAFVVLEALDLLHGDRSFRASSDALKLACVALLALGVWLGRVGAGRREDARRVSIVFSFAVAGDVAFFFGRYATGIALFLGVQLLLAWRNGQGLPGFVLGGAWRDHRGRLALTALGAAALLGGAGAILAPLAPPRMAPGLLVLAATYAAALALSVGVAWLSPALGFLAPRRGAQAALGMTLFFACDVTVALGVLLPGPAAQVARALTWLFYASALALLALSGRAERAGGRGA
jgi:hypothetical protein